MAFDGSPILPAGQVLFGKTKVALHEINKQWKTGTVVIVKKPNGQPHFIAGSSGDYYEIGQMVQFYHDQTGVNYPGKWEVIDEVRYTTGDRDNTFDATTKSGHPVPLLLKAALSVFK